MAKLAKQYVTTKTIARRMAVTNATAWRWCRKHRLLEKFEGAVRVDQAEFERVFTAIRQRA